MCGRFGPGDHILAKLGKKDYKPVLSTKFQAHSPAVQEKTIFKYILFLKSF